MTRISSIAKPQDGSPRRISTRTSSWPRFWIALARRDSPALAPALSLGCRVQPRESESGKHLPRGSERDLELEGDTRHRVERVVPGLCWDARVPEKIRIVGLAVYHVAVDVEDLRARRPKVRIVRPRRQRRRSGKRSSQHHKRTSHNSPLPRPWIPPGPVA